MPSPRLILASTSSYRAELLRRLGVPFEQLAPGVDETALPGEDPAARALRLAVAKADAVARMEPAGCVLIVGSDQVAEQDGLVLDKPGNIRTATAQLEASSGRKVRFHTALCVTQPTPWSQKTHVDQTDVFFRPLNPAEISRYLEREQPTDCAGSFKCEGLGISLFERVATQDPTALIGLPLIALARLLRECGLSIP